jgi:radical SAM protein with 4Fe4S-binding SPASM domain
MKRVDMRPPQYHYYNQLMEHVKDKEIFFSDNFIYPRQFEIHLPGDKRNSCNLHCGHCAGKLFDKSLGHWEVEGLHLLHNLKGAIPYHIYGGAYTEPMMNPYYMAYLATTKYYGNHFGIHTNGTLLATLEDKIGFLTELNRISTDDVDYLSVSIDAGLSESWAKTKGTRNIEWFDDEILRGLEMATSIRKRVGKSSHAIRMCYLISPYSDSDENFRAIIEHARRIGVDSLRFSIPFANYNQSFDKVREYKYNRELKDDEDYYKRLEPYLSKSKDESPYIFYTGPEFTDVDKFDFEQCIYGYYQITYGADGYVYKCSTTATPTGKQCRLGKITSSLEDFQNMIRKNYNSEWSSQKNCFDCNLRCNRMGLEINSAYQEFK